MCDGCSHCVLFLIYLAYMINCPFQGSVQSLAELYAMAVSFSGKQLGISQE